MCGLVRLDFNHLIILYLVKVYLLITVLRARMLFKKLFWSYVAV
jgi:hypothetical protein